MSEGVVSFSMHHVKRVPFNTQRDAISYSIRQSIASIGVVGPELIFAACSGLCKGLFGEAWKTASEGQRLIWLNTAVDEYERITDQKAQTS